MMKTACFTGHRRLPKERMEEIASAITREISRAYEEGYRRFLCGGALGFDTLAAKQTLLFRETHPDVRLEMILPCRDQADKWPENDRAVYREILRRADETVVLSEAYHPGCMQTRNRYLVEHASLCICCMFSFHGGTAYTVRYALYRGLDIRNVAMGAGWSGQTMREVSWSYISTFHSAKENADTARSLPSREWKPGPTNTLTFSCGKRKAGRTNSPKK